MGYQFGNEQFEPGSKYLTLDLPDSNDLLDDPSALRARLRNDGFLLIRGLHDPAEVLQARMDMLTVMAEEGKLDLNAPLAGGVINPAHPGDTATVRGRDSLKTESLKRVVNGPRAMKFFDNLFGGKSRSLAFQWLRAAGPGAASGIHCDVVYMGRGSRNLHTMWTPFGEIPPEMGPLVVCLGSHRWQEVISTYGRDDVDVNSFNGVFSNDPKELVDRFGGRWATTTFYPGDAIIVSMHLMHASLTNTTNRYRISCDTRYQPADDSVDERWSGDQPMGHPVMWGPNAQLESLDTSRKRWGL
jgi:hypothetical protein